jgi:predicted DNA-binding protein
VAGRILSGMNTRFEFRLPEPARRQLHQLSNETGLSSADLVRLGISKLLQDRDALPKLPLGDRHAA